MSAAALAGGSAIATGGMSIYMRGNYGPLVSSSRLTCVPDTNGNCMLGGSYGIGLEAVNFVSIAFNFILLVLMLRKWARVSSGSLSIKTTSLRTAFTLLTLASIVALAFNGYTVFLTTQFGSQVAKGNLGTECAVVDTCKTLGGSTGNVQYALAIASVALSGLSLVSYGYTVSREGR